VNDPRCLASLSTDDVVENLRGQVLAQHFIDRLHDRNAAVTDPDHLFNELRALKEDAAALRGFSRQLQKILEARSGLR
jgi:hypothetical protein